MSQHPATCAQCSEQRPHFHSRPGSPASFRGYLECRGCGHAFIGALDGPRWCDDCADGNRDLAQRCRDGYLRAAPFERD
jgi:hypothetical protein